jgi:hypothetical protein
MTTTATPREAITTALAQAISDLAAQQARVEPLQRAATHAYLGGKADDGSLAATRLAIVNLSDVIAGLRTLDAEAEAIETAAEIEALQSIATDVDNRTPELMQREMADRYAHYDETDPLNEGKTKVRRALHAEIDRLQAQRAAARQRISELRRSGRSAS